MFFFSDLDRPLTALNDRTKAQVRQQSQCVVVSKLPNRNGTPKRLVALQTSAEQHTYSPRLRQPAADII